MNGIIHTCSHPNDEDVHFRISEEKIFQDICRYIEFLFSMIKPRKVFFMAVDGVAPRAKMNQQRGRRFRSAKEAETRELEAKHRGEELPKEARFDSNCITPGTEFMDRLHQMLKYFVAYKISTDDLWKRVKVILSGHETPGEGEHKIMDFIRYEKSQRGYDPNTRHCLYGLDADLIMLGLCSHEPYFALLREEVKYIKTKEDHNKKKNIRDVNPETTTFHLLHLSLFRDYIDHEFAVLKRQLPFQYNLENIIDDWVLMGLLVGNDFIPHIPNFHINKNSLVKLFQAYIELLPSLDGYLNENGKLNLFRFQKYIQKLTLIDLDNFNDQYADIKYFEGKTGKQAYNRGDTSAFADFGAKKNSSNNITTSNRFNANLIDLDDDIQVIDDEEGKVMDENDDFYENSEDEDNEEMFQDEFKNYKRHYYMNKLAYNEVDSNVLKEQAHAFVRAIQWNLHYYYDGCVSWSWYYPHHYAPYISDVNDFLDIDLDFKLGKPFLPFEQLLGVLPAASKQFLPKPYQRLVDDVNSPLIEYYPNEFQTDLNGKMQAWEALVLIPFIDEKRLLDACDDCNKYLSYQEKRRNKHGPHLIYTYAGEESGMLESPFANVLPDLDRNFAKCVAMDQDAFRLPSEKIRKGLAKGINLNLHMPNFPTLKFVSHRFMIKKERVRVFETASLRDSMVLYVNQQVDSDIEKVAEDYLGKIVFANWPHFIEARVVQVFDPDTKYEFDRETGEIIKKRIHDKERYELCSKIKHVINHYKYRYAINVGDVDIILLVTPISSRKFKRINGKVVLEKEYNSMPVTCPLQVIVKDIQVYEPAFECYDKVEDETEIATQKVTQNVTQNVEQRKTTQNQPSPQLKMLNIWKQLGAQPIRNLSSTEFPPLNDLNAQLDQSASVSTNDDTKDWFVKNQNSNIDNVSNQNYRMASRNNFTLPSDVNSSGLATNMNNSKISGEFQKNNQGTQNSDERKQQQSYVEILRKYCAKTYHRLPILKKILYGTTMKIPMMSVILPDFDHTTFNVPCGQFETDEEARENVAKQALQSLNILADEDGFVNYQPKNKAYNKHPPSIASIPLPPMHWIKQNKQSKRLPIHEIPESFVEQNRKLYNLDYNQSVNQ